MSRALDEAQGRAEKKILADVQKHGWHVIYVAEDDSGPGYAFTIGLADTFKHPELVMVGQSQELLHVVLNNIGSDIRGGSALRPGETTRSALDDLDCAVLEVTAANREEWLGLAVWWHRGVDFRALQIVWPDKQNRLPWSGMAKDSLSRQPLLGPQR